MTLFSEVEKDIHGGTMGWADEAFYTSVLQFAKEQKAPKEVTAAVMFMRGVSSFNWIEAADQVDTLLFAIENGLKWVDPDAFRDGAVVALLKTGQYNKARQVFNRMGERTARKAGDLRVQMLGAAVAQVATATPPAATTTPTTTSKR